MSVNLNELSKDDLIRLLSRQSKKMIRAGNELQVAYRRLALHECTGNSCSKCKGGVE